MRLVEAWKPVVETASQRLVLLCLDSFRCGATFSLPISLICDNTLLNRKTVIKVLSELESLSIIKYFGVKSKRGVKEYTLTFVTVGNDSTPPLGTPPLGTPPLGTPPLGTPPLGTPPLGTPKQAVCDDANTSSNSKTINQSSDNTFNELWEKFVETRKSVGADDLTEWNVEKILKEISKASQETGDSREEVLQLAIDRGWKFIKAEWYVDAKTKRKSSSKNKDDDVIKAAYLDATQGIFKSSEALQTAKLVGEFELRTKPEKYIYHKWSSTYRDVVNGLLERQATTPILNQDNRNTVVKNVANDEFAKNILNSIKQTIGRRL